MEVFFLGSTTPEKSCEGLQRSPTILPNDQNKGGANKVIIVMQNHIKYATLDNHEYFFLVHICRFYAVLKDEWLYLYKKPSDTCTVDAYDMPSFVVSANVGSDSLRNFKNQKLSISLEHKVNI